MPRSTPSATPSGSTRRRLLIALSLLLILLAGAAARFYRLGDRSLWVDEIYTYLSTTGTHFHPYVSTPQNLIVNPLPLTDPAHAAPWWKTLRPDTDDIHPPLYFFLLRLWTNLAGWEASGLRAFSVFASLAAIALLFAAVKEWSGRGAGIGAAAIMAFAQPQLRLAQEARSYTLVLALAAAGAWALARIERRGINRRRILALSILSLVLPFVHYFAMPVIATFALYSLLRLRGTTRRAVLFATCGPALLFLVSWFPILRAQAHGASGGGTTYFVDQEPDHFHQTFSRLALVSARSLYEPLSNAVTSSMILSGISLFPLLLLRRRPDLLIWTLWVPMNVLPTLIIDLTQHSWSLGIERYTLPATLGIYALLASVGLSFPRRLTYALPCLAVLGCLLHIDQAYNTEDRVTQQKWRQLAGMYRDIARPGDLTVFAAAGTPRYSFMYYLCLGHYAYPLPGQIALITRRPTPELLEQIRGRSGVVLVGDGDAADAYFPTAHVTELNPIVFLGEVARLTFPPPPASRPAAISGSASHRPPTSPAASSPAR